MYARCLTARVFETRCAQVNFFNNKIVCDLIEARRPPGVLAVLDDVCKTMHREGEGVYYMIRMCFVPLYCSIRLGSYTSAHVLQSAISSSGVDIKFLQKAEQTVSNQHFIPRQKDFTIRHYAGDVIYDVDGV